MQISVPIYVQHQRGRTSTPPITARPLFFGHPSKSGSELGKVIATLKNKLRIKLSDLARGDNHEELLSWHEPELVQDSIVKLRLDLRDSTATIRLLLVGVRRHQRLLAFSPSLPDLWFDVIGGESIESRAREVYESHFRQCRKDSPDYVIQQHNLEGKAWIDQVTIDILPTREAKKTTDPLRAILGGEDVSDGATQLRKVGRCLSWVDEDELCEPIGVDTDVDRLSQLLDVGDRRGVVLVGPSGSGKTARIEGAVRRRRARQKASTRQLVWQLSPARLISGMSYLGQWQERVLAILKHAHRYDHVLYFDDLLGLFEAGKTRDSSMCVADTLRAQLDVRPVRILAEMTNEAWAIFRERDRTLADRLVVLPTEALDAAQSMKTLIGIRRRLEATRRCKFDLDVLPEVVSMYDRFDRSSVLPGKAAAALSRLAARCENQNVTRSDGIAEFQSRSGLQTSIIDRRLSIDRESITQRIRREVVGQDRPVTALIDRILIAAARMNDTGRPLGTFLLVGPTGVGKTQLAKAVAGCLFDEGGLIRLDMNELSSPASAARLIGTFDAPDGLLTSAVRRRPNAVLLLDEIEKAHPAVLDVLLQALGEARLSDARGRTVDLSGLLILMTSNLGSRESGRGRGFADADDEREIRDVHTRAAREFFRPEFFNRIDDVLSFDQLSKETMESIAWMQFRQILRRDGLQRRSVLIDVDPAAISQTASRGYDPRMGARALKRQIERDLVGPAAEVLAASSNDQPTLLRLYLDGTQVRTRWQAIEYAARDSVREPSIDELCIGSEKWLESVAGEVEGAPLRFELVDDQVEPRVLETMTLRDSLLECRQSLIRLNEARDRPRLERPQSTPIHAPGVGVAYSEWADPKHATRMRDLQALDDILDYLRESLVEDDPGEMQADRDRFTNELIRFRGQLDARGTSTRWLVRMRRFGEHNSIVSEIFSRGDENASLNRAILDWVTRDESLVDEEVEFSDDLRALCISGAFAKATLDEITGGWMFVRSNGDLSLVDVQSRSLGADESPLQALQAWDTDGEFEVSKVRRILQASGPLVDLTSGAAVNEKVSASSILKLLQRSRRSLDFLVAGEVQ